MQFDADKSNVPYRSNASSRRTLRATGSPCRAIVCSANADEHCSSLHIF
ncbi:MAG: hypothetical protein IKS21_03220 [Oscillospiraceae bacterium]|nr:hypothetical protein [Oscillospiraceae bacterium]